MTIFTKLEENNPKICILPQNIPNSQTGANRARQNKLKKKKRRHCIT